MPPPADERPHPHDRRGPPQGRQPVSATFDEAQETFSRTPPHDLDAEQCVLGCLLAARDVIGDIQDILTAEHFYRPAHGLIFETILALFEKGDPCNPVSVNAELVRRGDIGRAGGPATTHQLFHGAPASASATYYADIVLEQARLRSLVEAGSRIMQMGYAAEGDIDEIENAAHALLSDAIRTEDVDEEVGALGDGLDDIFDELERGRDGMAGVPTGFIDFDALTDGLHPGQLIVIAARPAMGKSTFAVDIARHAAIREGKHVAIFSLEMGKKELTKRIISAEARVGLHHIVHRQVTDDDWTRIACVTERLATAPLHINARPGQTPASIKARCRKMQQGDGLDLVIVDYLQLMESAAGRKSDNRQQEVASMSRAFKVLAKELGIPVIVLSQLNRGPEQRADKKPAMSDLRESGAIEQDADVVILLHREDAYDKESPRAGEADLIVEKNRNGPNAIITVAFQGHFSRFVDMASG
ncbi:replicative DNA helicase [Streptomyces sp. NRRL F-5135]|uniref:replicative DNA helicase n=1 Tax=Streptomyces sp. NRRL F-5135 TaxID=1463858 RepID=UPI00099B28AB